MTVSYALNQGEVECVQRIVHSDTEVGFLWFYHLTNGLPIPGHCVGWDVEYYRARRMKLALAIESFRGSIKTTFFSGCMTAYQIGCHPELEHLILQAGDEVAEENTAFVSSLIQHDPGWHFCFPTVMPDAKKWGAEGYEVVDTSITYGEFRRLRTKTPTFVGAGYTSAVTLGKHPRGHFIRDDVHNYKNTRSSRLLQGVKDVVFKEMQPAADRASMVIDLFTPWVRGDVGDTRKRQRSVWHVRTAVYQYDKDGNLTNIPTWPELFPEEKIATIREEIGPTSFAQNYLLDLEALSGVRLKESWLITYPWDDFESLSKVWPVGIGLDYATVERKLEIQGRDYFALACGKMHPRGFLVIFDGFFGHLTRPDAEDVAMSWGERYFKDGTMRGMGIEKLGKGEEFANWMLSKAPFRVKKQGVGNQSKAYRFEVELAPLFRNGRIRILDHPTNEFIRELRNEWLSFDGLDSYPDDCLDAVYHLVQLFKGFLRPEKEPDWVQIEEPNPYMAFAEG